MKNNSPLPKGNDMGNEIFYAKKNIRSMIWRYFFGFSIVFFSCYIAFSMLNRIIDKQNDDIKIVHIINEKRMIVEKILIKSNSLMFEKTSDRQYVIRRDISQLIQELKAYRNKLIEVIKIKGYFFDENEIIILHNEIDDYIRNSMKFYQLSSGDINSGNENYRYLKINNENINISMGKIVEHYKNRKYFDVLKRYKYVFIFSYIVIIFVGMAVIIYPINCRLMHAYRNIYKANNAKSEFLSSMSHEIITPMNGIIGNTENLMAGYLEGKQKKYAKIILDSAENLLEIINDILDYSRMESGSFCLDERTFNLEVLSKEIIQQLTLRAQEKNLELILRYTQNTPQFVVGDPARISQILANLIGNGIKFTSEGYVSLTIGVDGASEVCRGKKKPEEARLAITVKDTGIGISKDKYDLIFEKFSQADRSSTRNYEGVGVGLTICKTIVEMMDGTIAVDSVEGKGSTFTLSLPFGVDVNARESLSAPEILKGLKVIVVDDMEVNRNLLKEQLIFLEMQCITCSSGKEALKELNFASMQGVPYQICIMDYMMPGMDGELLTKEIKLSPLLSKMPIVVLSSMGEQGYIKQLAGVGVSAILSKPVRAEKLLHTLVDVWDGHKNNTKVEMTREGGLKGACVLLVEDNRINSALAEEMLGEQGVVVVCAENGQVAVDIVRSNLAIDLVLMDCMMPVMDGFTATENIRNLPQVIGRELPIIALTANAMKGDKEKCIDAGMNDYLSKPVRRKELYPMISKWIPGDRQNPSGCTKNKNMPAEGGALVVSKGTYNPELIPEGFNINSLDIAKKTMKNKFSIMVKYFIEDTEVYINEIDKGLSDNNVHVIIASAHTIKSSSKQIGADLLSESAKEIEFIARELLEDKLTDRTISDIYPTVNHIKLEFSKVNIFLSNVLMNEKAE